MDLKISFIRGLRSKYTEDVYRNGVYFAEDTNEILVNGVSYGLSTLTKNAIFTAINAKVANVEFTVPGTFKFVDGENNTITTITLVTATLQQAGFMSAEDKAALDDLVNNRFSVKVDDKVLALNENMELFSTLKLEYNVENKEIQLLGQNNAEISSIDASPFIVDGMVHDVEVVVNPEGYAPGTYIKITFNTDAGKTPIYVNMADFIDKYDGSKLYLTGYTEVSQATPITEADTVNVAIAKLAKLIEENENITAAALVDINNRLNKVSSDSVLILEDAKAYTDDALTWILT